MRSQECARMPEAGWDPQGVGGETRSQIPS
jgi:hypothetical protein